MWQPARIRAFHQIDLKDLPGYRVVVRVRPAVPDAFYLHIARSVAHCDAEQFYELHPDDREKIGLPKHLEWVGRVVFCEHQVLTD